MRRLKLHAALTGAVMLACTPTLDWREVRPEASGALALFPCKPKSQTRSATLADTRVSMTLVSCEAGGMTFALSHADLGDPSRVTAALAEMRSSLAGNLGAADVRAAAFDVAGMTPNPQAVRIKLEGSVPDGSRRLAQGVLFSRGTRVYQAVVLGAQLDESAAAVFFESLRLPS